MCLLLWSYLVHCGSCDSDTSNTRFLEIDVACCLLMSAVLMGFLVGFS
ncbi:uncharacterized protein LOC110229483 [Arabidopsis lyrata subsp. lyrata]|nr:uncharacterized protein LOC110229483 [Arabidopsis lyrata subsp. lyrata]|eukprot:XP_020885448.1 uncharacterized protein LOC110229483 [Arabidopsis lyrata subsp. lyrata]